jgi:hypothetical protein
VVAAINSRKSGWQGDCERKNEPWRSCRGLEGRRPRHVETASATFAATGEIAGLFAGCTLVLSGRPTDRVVLVGLALCSALGSGEPSMWTERGPRGAEIEATKAAQFRPEARAIPVDVLQSRCPGTTTVTWTPPRTRFVGHAPGFSAPLRARETAQRSLLVTRARRGLLR